MVAAHRSSPYFHDPSPCASPFSLGNGHEATPKKNTVHYVLHQRRFLPRFPTNSSIAVYAIFSSAYTSDLCFHPCTCLVAFFLPRCHELIAIATLYLDTLFPSRRGTSPRVKGTFSRGASSLQAARHRAQSGSRVCGSLEILSHHVCRRRCGHGRSRRDSPARP